MRVRVLGLGRMGLPVAGRMRAAGHDVVGDDLDRGRFALFEEGASDQTRAAAGVRRDADVLVTVLPGPVELRRAMLGSVGRMSRSSGVDESAGDEAGRTPASVATRSRAGGALAGIGEGGLWIDLTSGDPRVARELAARAAEFGVSAVAAPMAGGPADAEAGTLGFFVAGAPDAVERALPLLHALGDPDRIERAGHDVGAAHAAKLLANTLWFGQVAAVTEVLLIGQAQGLEPEALAAILRRSAGGSVFLDRHLDALLDGDYLETFGIDRVVEELDTVAGLAADAGLGTPLTALVARLHREALARFGPVDGELLVAKLLEERAGTRIRRSADPA